GGDAAAGGERESAGDGLGGGAAGRGLHLGAAAGALIPLQVRIGTALDVDVAGRGDVHAGVRGQGRLGAGATGVQASLVTRVAAGGEVRVAARADAHRTAGLDGDGAGGVLDGLALGGGSQDRLVPRVVAGFDLQLLGSPDGDSTRRGDVQARI